MDQMMNFDVESFFDGYFDNDMLPEHPVDSAHDNLHHKNVNIVMRDSKRNYTIDNDNLRKDHDNLFVEVLKKEYPLLYDSIEYFHPEEFEYKHKSNMPICYDDSDLVSGFLDIPFSLFSIYDAGTHPKVPIPLPPSQFIDSASTTDGPTNSGSFSAISTYSVGDVLISRTIFPGIGDNTQSGMPNTIYANVTANLMWQLTLIYSFMTSSVSDTLEFKTAIYILSRIVFRIDKTNVKRLEYKIYSGVRDDLYYETIYNKTILNNETWNDLNTHISYLNDKNPIESYTNSWDRFTGTISQSNCSQYIQKLGYIIPNARSDNPVSSTIFGTIDIYCKILSGSTDSELQKLEINKIKYYTAQLLKYTGDTSHIICRRLLSYVINREDPTNKNTISRICNAQTYNNIFSIFTNDRPLIYRSILKTLHEGEAVVFPALACYQDDKFFKWYDSFQINDNNINVEGNSNYVRPKKCFCKVVNEAITPDIILENLLNKISEIENKIKKNEYKEFRGYFQDLISSIKNDFEELNKLNELNDLNRKRRKRSNSEKYENLKNAYKSIMNKFSEQLKIERDYFDIVSYSEKISGDALGVFMSELDTLVRRLFQRRVRNGTDLSNKLFLLDGSRIKNDKIPEEFYVHLDKIEYFSLMYDKYISLYKKNTDNNIVPLPTVTFFNDSVAKINQTIKEQIDRISVANLFRISQVKSFKTRTDLRENSRVTYLNNLVKYLTSIVDNNNFILSKLPSGIQNVMPSGMPGAMQSGIQNVMQSGMPGGIPNVMSSGMPGGMPGGNPGAMQSGNPRGMRGGMQTEIPGDISGTDPRSLLLHVHMLISNFYNDHSSSLYDISERNNTREKNMLVLIDILNHLSINMLDLFETIFDFVKDIEVEEQVDNDSYSNNFDNALIFHILSFINQYSGIKKVYETSFEQRIDGRIDPELIRQVNQIVGFETKFLDLLRIHIERYYGTDQLYLGPDLTTYLREMKGLIENAKNIKMKYKYHIFMGLLPACHQIFVKNDANSDFMNLSIELQNFIETIYTTIKFDFDTDFKNINVQGKLNKIEFYIQKLNEIGNVVHQDINHIITSYDINNFFNAVFSVIQPYNPEIESPRDLLADGDIYEYINDAKMIYDSISASNELERHGKADFNRFYSRYINGQDQIALYKLNNSFEFNFGYHQSNEIQEYIQNLMTLREYINRNASQYIQSLGRGGHNAYNGGHIQNVLQDNHSLGRYGRDTYLEKKMKSKTKKLKKKTSFQRKKTFRKKRRHRLSRQNADEKKSTKVQQSKKNVRGNKNQNKTKNKDDDLDREQKRRNTKTKTKKKEKRKHRNRKGKSTMKTPKQ
jgi:hypothetical protein